MFKLIVTKSLHNRLFVLAAAVILIVFGLFTLPRVPIDALDVSN